MVPRWGVCEQDAHPRARGRGLEPVGHLEHVQPHVWHGSPLPAEEMRQPSVSPPDQPSPGCLDQGFQTAARIALAEQGLSPTVDLS